MTLYKERNVCNVVGGLSAKIQQRCIYTVMIRGFAEGLARQQR
jgi:hypothetical protein